MPMLHSRWAMMMVTLICVALYLWPQCDQGWVPHDEGLLGQSATRVLDGELPHIDFDDPYTGGQAMLHALAMKVFGEHSIALRWLLFIFTCGFSVAAYLISVRMMPAWGAMLVALLATAWSVPNYFAPLPSWYNLFFAAFGTLAFIKFDETSHRKWLLIAGLMGGLSFLIKVAGLYYIAAGLLFLVYRDQQIHGDELGATPRRSWFTVFVCASLVCFCLFLVMLVRSRLTPMDVIHFVLPGCTLAAFLIVNQWRVGESNAGQLAPVERMKRLTTSVGLFLLAAALPVLIFLVPYVGQSGMAAWIEGVFILPQKRILFANYPMPPLGTIWAVLPYAALLILPMIFAKGWNHVALISVAWIASIFALFFAASSPIYESVWNMARPLIPLMTVVGILLLFRSPHKPACTKDPALFLLLAMTAMTSLVQFPYSFAIYLCYCIPIGVIALAAIVIKQDRAPMQLHFAAAFFFFGFAVLWINHGRVQRIGVQFVADDQNTVLDLPRSGLRVSQVQAKLYKDVIKTIERHSEQGSTIYASVDCPEIYFLADRKNPTRCFYEFFEPDFADDSATRLARVEKILDQEGIEVVVFRWKGEFSGDVPIDLAQKLAPMFPNFEHFVREGEVEPTFSVVWRTLDP
jgi:hypothetical protein